MIETRPRAGGKDYLDKKGLSSYPPMSLHSLTVKTYRHSIGKHKTSNFLWVWDSTTCSVKLSFILQGWCSHLVYRNVTKWTWMFSSEISCMTLPVSWINACFKKKKNDNLFSTFTPLKVCNFKIFIFFFSLFLNCYVRKWLYLKKAKVNL